jgi:hypothetical protein
MRMHEQGSFMHMSGAATIEEARVQARTLEQRERSRAGNLKNARATLARRAGVSPATWRNLAQGRLKRLDAWLRDRLCALIIRELEADIARLEHDLARARSRGDHLGSQHVCEIETHLAKARAILKG